MTDDLEKQNGEEQDLPKFENSNTLKPEVKEEELNFLEGGWIAC